MRVWDCRALDLPTYAAEFVGVRQSARGSVAAGFLTSHTVERRATDDGALLGRCARSTPATTPPGTRLTITSTREDGAIRTVTLDYDPFGLAPVHVKTRRDGRTARGNEDHAGSHHASSR